MRGVFVATVPTRYPSIAVAQTATDAIQLAANHALNFLKENRAIESGRTDTVEGVIEYFGVSVINLEMNSATFMEG